jgi:hypothetical protein
MGFLLRRPLARYKQRVGLLFLIGAALCGQSCKQSAVPVVDDPQLKPIQATLQEHVPIGSTQGTVSEFLTSRGYTIEPNDQANTLIAKIRHIDTDKMQPVTARVTFHFDGNGKLSSYEIVRTLNDPIPQ